MNAMKRSAPFRLPRRRTITVTAGAVYGACLVTGAIWLLVGVKRVADLVSRPVVVGTRYPPCSCCSQAAQ
jgi:hypothetical protein